MPSDNQSKFSHAIKTFKALFKQETEQTFPVTPSKVSVPHLFNQKYCRGNFWKILRECITNVFKIIKVKLFIVKSEYSEE